MTGHKANGDAAWSSLLEPPYSRELLADLHAGALDEELASALWPRVRAEQGAGAVLGALDATVRQLHAAAEHPGAVPIPAGVAARIDAALAGQSPQPVAVTDLAAVRAHRRRRGAYAGAALVAAAAAVAGVVSLNAALGSNTVAGTPQAGAPAPSPPPLPLDLGSGALGSQALAVVGRHDLGPLNDNAVLAGCLQANGIPAETAVIGASPVLLNGKQGILLLLPSGRAAVFTALVVGRECSAQNADTRSKVEIGAR